MSEHGVWYQSEGDQAQPPDVCQSCMNWYPQKYTDSNAYSFDFIFSSFVELDANGHDCCLVASQSCNPGTGCDTHAITLIYPVFNQTEFNNTATFWAGLSALSPQLTSCTAPGQSQAICPNVNITYQLLNQAQNITIGKNGSIYAPGDALFGKVRISQWSFYSTSTGLKLKLQVGVQNSRINVLTLQPGNNVTSTPPIPTIGGFDTVVITDFYGRQGAVTFGLYALVDGRQVNVNISGVYPHGYDPSQVYVVIEVPKFSSYAEWYFVLFDPSVSNYYNGGVTTSGMLWTIIVLVLLVHRLI